MGWEAFDLPLLSATCDLTNWCIVTPSGGPMLITVAVSASYRDKTCSISPLDAHKNLEGTGTLAILLDKVFF